MSNRYRDGSPFVEALEESLASGRASHVQGNRQRLKRLRARLTAEGLQIGDLLARTQRLIDVSCRKTGDQNT